MNSRGAYPESVTPAFFDLPGTNVEGWRRSALVSLPTTRPHQNRRSDAIVCRRHKRRKRLASRITAA
jgi:hypothetical protein